MKWLPLAALLLLLLVVAAGVLLWGMLTARRVVTDDARACAEATVAGTRRSPDYSRIRTDAAHQRWLRIYNAAVDARLDDDERQVDTAVELNRAMTLKTFETEARRELGRTRRAR